MSIAEGTPANSGAASLQLVPYQDPTRSKFYSSRAVVRCLTGKKMKDRTDSDKCFLTAYMRTVKAAKASELERTQQYHRTVDLSKSVQTYGSACWL